MGIGKDFSLVSVHSHVLLLGWATLAIDWRSSTSSCPGARAPAWPRRHFWLAQPRAARDGRASLAAEALGAPRAEPFVGLGSILVIVGLGLFTLNVLRNAKAEDAGA